MCLKQRARQLFPFREQVTPCSTQAIENCYFSIEVSFDWKAQILGEVEGTESEDPKYSKHSLKDNSLEKMTGGVRRSIQSVKFGDLYLLKFRGIFLGIEAKDCDCQYI